MKILVVEDDDYKRGEVKSFLTEAMPTASLFEARSAQSAVRALTLDRFACIILDMSLPTFDMTSAEHGGRPQPLGGKEVLYEIERRDLVTPVIVLTQFTTFERSDVNATDLDLAELDRELCAEFSNNYRGAVFYDGDGAWRGQRRSMIATIY